MTSKSPCLELVRTGECPDRERCTLNHDLPHCEICERYFNSLGNFSSHIAGGPHSTRLASLDVEVNTLPNGRIQCKLCLSQMKPKHWQRHVASPQHILKLKYRRAQDAKAIAESNKSTVQLSPEDDIDFGLIEFEEMTEKTAAHQPTRLVTIDPGESKVVLESVKFRENSQNAGHRHFSVQSFARATTIKPGEPLKVSVHFQPRNDIGSYEDLLVFDFSVHGEGESFSIQRTVKGSVGVKDDIEQFSSKVPYIKPELRNRPRADEKNTIAAPREDDFKQNVPWTGRLPWFHTPNWLEKVLELPLIGEQIRELRRYPGGLSYANYQKFWTTLLYVEANQEEVDVRRYDIENTTLKSASGGHFFLKVPGLAEKRPSVLRSDKVKVQTRNSSDKKWYEGLVVDVEQSRVGLKFDKTFQPASDATFDVQFAISRIPIRRQLQALGGPLVRSQLLFPTLSLQTNAIPEGGDHQFVSKAIESNHAQKEAVLAILNNTSGEAPYVVFGPPGTGKTVTIIETVHQLVKFDATILLTAPSNSAADLLCRRLDLSNDVLFRLNAPSRMTDDVLPDIKEYSYLEDGSFACPAIEKLKDYKVVVSTCISASILKGVGLKEGHFSHIFVDEAGQATEPEAFLPISLASKGTGVILAGDPKQLGPIIRSPVAATLGLETSFLERLMSTPQYNHENLEYRGITYTKLVKNYRNHSAILATSNKEFYANELQPCAPVSITASLHQWEGWPNKDFPIIFHSIKGRDEREGTSPSFLNVPEISMIRNYVDRLRRSRKVKVDDSDIGIIAPYSAQCSKLRIALKQHDRPQLTIGSVEQFQGSERSVILMSTVRSNKEYLEQDKRFAIGFLSNEKRFNVAVTRPQAGLIAIGNPDILSLDPLWRRFLVYVHDNGGWKGSKWDPTPFRDEAFDPAEAARQEMEQFTGRFDALANLSMDA